MKATELIDELDRLIMKHGDCDVYYEYDSGIRITCTDVTYFKHIDCNAYSEHWGELENAFIINHDKEANED